MQRVFSEILPGTGAQACGCEAVPGRPGQVCADSREGHGPGPAAAPISALAPPRRAGPHRLTASSPPRRETKVKANGETSRAAMAGHGRGTFPLLVRGDWGAAEPPLALRKKLLCYFQSQKRSGGGECDLRAGTATGDLLVCFACPEGERPGRGGGPGG